MGGAVFADYTSALQAARNIAYHEGVEEEVIVKSQEGEVVQKTTVSKDIIPSAFPSGEIPKEKLTQAQVSGEPTVREIVYSQPEKMLEFEKMGGAYGYWAAQARKKWGGIPIGSAVVEGKAGVLIQPDIPQYKESQSQIFKTFERKEFLTTSIQTVTQKDISNAVEQGMKQGEATYDVSQAFNKASTLERIGLGLQPLFSPRGLEYRYTFLPQNLQFVGPTTKRPEDIVKEQMLESVVNKDFIKEQTIGSLWGSPTGHLGISMLTGYGVGAVAGEIIPRLPSIPILTGIGKAIVSHPKETIVVAGSIFGASEVMKQKQMQEAGFTPEQRAGEFTKDVIGFYGFQKGFIRGFQEGVPFKFLGKEYVPAENIIEPQVLSGKEAFPTSQQSPQSLLKEFQTTQFKLYQDATGGWHATTSYFAKVTTTQAGTSELSGMYISPSLSPHFLGITDVSYSYVTKPVSGAGAKALWIQTDVELAPENILGNVPAAKEWLMEKAPKGTAFILGTKTEKEAIIPPASELLRTSQGFWGFEKFTKISDIRVPIFEYKTVSVGGEAAASIVKNFAGINELASSYGRGAEFTGIWASEVAASVRSSMPSSPSQPFKSLVSSASKSSISSVPSIPSYPSIPSTTSYPSKISIPSMPSIPSIPSVPSYPSIPSVPSIISPPSISLFGIPMFGFAPRRRRKYFKSRQPRAYLPSMGAVLMGIKGSMPKSFGGMLTGLEMRPLVSRRRRRKRR